MTQRIRVKYQDTAIPAWTMDFDGGGRYRIIRPDAAAELVSIESERSLTFMRQPEPEELESLKVKGWLREKGHWAIQRIQDIPRSHFDRSRR